MYSTTLGLDHSGRGSVHVYANQGPPTSINRKEGSTGEMFKIFKIFKIFFLADP